MEKGLLFFTLSILCIWIILDEFFGNKYLSNFLIKLTPEMSIKLFPEPLTEKEKAEHHQDMKDSVDKNLKATDKGKESIKNIIDFIYEGGNPGREQQS